MCTQLELFTICNAFMCMQFELFQLFAMYYVYTIPTILTCMIKVSTVLPISAMHGIRTFPIGEILG